VSAPERDGMRFMLSPDKRKRKPFRPDPEQMAPEMREEAVRRDDERQRAQEVRDAARLATLWMRDAIRAIEDLDYVDRVGFLSEGADRLDAVAAELDRRMERLQTALRTVLDSEPSEPPHLGTLKGRECSKQGTIDPSIAALFTSGAEGAKAMQRRINATLHNLDEASGNLALHTEPEVPKPGQHLKSRPSGKPAGPSDRHGGALNPTAAPDGSGPGGGG
jgi:hypothetical protein